MKKIKKREKRVKPTIEPLRIGQRGRQSPKIIQSQRFHIFDGSGVIQDPYPRYKILFRYSVKDKKHGKMTVKSSMSARTSDKKDADETAKKVRAYFSSLLED